uniref:Uncharacterized protein n=1 Tax=Cacopsylla melanoneura TaxID=428564 RepID=A0A8D8Q2E9_9HEMI
MPIVTKALVGHSMINVACCGDPQERPPTKNASRRIQKETRTGTVASIFSRKRLPSALKRTSCAGYSNASLSLKSFNLEQTDMLDIIRPSLAESLVRSCGVTQLLLTWDLTHLTNLIRDSVLMAPAVLLTRCASMENVPM